MGEVIRFPREKTNRKAAPHGAAFGVSGVGTDYMKGEAQSLPLGVSPDGRRTIVHRPQNAIQLLPPPPAVPVAPDASLALWAICGGLAAISICIVGALAGWF